jgi:hypothetical protein
MFRGSVEIGYQFIRLRLKLNFDVVEYLVLDVGNRAICTETDSGVTHRT